MTWVRFDADHYDNPRVLAAPLDALGLDRLAHAWCAKHRTDGCIPAHAVRLLARTDDAMMRCVEVLCTAPVSLWQRRGDGFQLCDFLTGNPSRKSVQAQRKNATRRMRAWRARDGVTDASLTRHSRVSDASVRANLPPSSPLPASSSPLPPTPPISSPPPTPLSLFPPTRENARARGEGEGFDEFWGAYPWHIGKQAATRAWKQLSPDASLRTAILAAIAWQRQRGCLSARVDRDDRPIRLHPATWLHGARWHDEPEPETVARAVSPLMAAATTRQAATAAREARFDTRR